MISMVQLMITIGIFVAFLSDTFFASEANLEIAAPVIETIRSAESIGRWV